jgi:asparagine synthase (glutamine-hydrolysing)
MEALAAERAKKWGATVLLSGAGGDGVLDGDLRSFEYRTRAGDLRALADIARLRLPWRPTLARRLSGYVINPLLRDWIPETLLKRYRTRNVVDHLPWAGPRLRPILAQSTATQPEEHDEWQTRHALSHPLSIASDARAQLEAASGIRRVDIYLDPRVIELVASFPQEELFYGDRLRGLYRHAMKGLLPESLRLRADKASFEPMIDEVWANAGLEPLLTMEATADLGLVEPAPFREAVARVVRKERTLGGWLSVWPMIAVEGFLRALDAHRGPLAKDWSQESA